MLDEMGRQADELEAVPESQSVHELAADCPLLSPLSHEQISRLVEGAQERRFLKGQRLTLAEKEVQQIFLVRAGTTVETIGEERRYVGAGQLVPALDMLSTLHRCTVNAFTDCTVLQIKAQTIFSFIKENPSFEARVYRAALPSAVKCSDRSTLFTYQESKVRKMAVDAVFRKLRKNETVELEKGGFLFEGSLIVD